MSSDKKVLLKEWLTQSKKRIDSVDAEEIALTLFPDEDRSFLVLNGDIEISNANLLKLEKMVQRREQGEPLAYVLGRKWFYGREFLVDKNVLIPRPETEMMIDMVKRLCQEETSFLEVGTGSGCIAITLKKEFPEAQVVAVDISEDALGVAKENAKKLNADIQFVRADLLNGVESGEDSSGRSNPDEVFSLDYYEPDYILANLPYVDKKWEWLDLKSLGYEPGLALFAEEDGLALIYKLLDQIKKKYNKVDVLLEADPCQHDKIFEYGRKNGFIKQGSNGYIVWLSLDKNADV